MTTNAVPGPTRPNRLLVNYPSRVSPAQAAPEGAAQVTVHGGEEALTPRWRYAFGFFGQMVNEFKLFAPDRRSTWDRRVSAKAS